MHNVAFAKVEEFGCRVYVEELPVHRQFGQALPYVAISQDSVVPTLSEAETLSTFIFELRSMHGGNPKQSTSADANPFLVKKLADGTWIGRRATTEGWSSAVADVAALKRFF